ncbi:hypothetical protein GY45DRAFT_1335645 [Cubamyces sp. BRFM 1775]|nr:hypothetical protein GY45DRAFT_1335645 [Cubamyces sp. BRFM 1775]
MTTKKAGGDKIPSQRRRENLTHCRILKISSRLMPFATPLHLLSSPLRSYHPGCKALFLRWTLSTLYDFWCLVKLSLVEALNTFAGHSTGVMVPLSTSLCRNFNCVSTLGSITPNSRLRPPLPFTSTDFSQLRDEHLVGGLSSEQDVSLSLPPFSEPGQFYTSTAPDGQHTSSEQGNSATGKQLYASISRSPSLGSPALMSPWIHRSAAALHAPATALPSTSGLVTADSVSPSRSMHYAPLDTATSSVFRVQSPRSVVSGFSGEPEYTGSLGTVDFKWERFDRSKVVPQGSSSPLRAPAESEETFWSQPAMITANANCPAVTSEPTYGSHAEIDSSRIPSPAWNSDLVHETGERPAIDITSFATQSNRSQQDDEDSPFVWILPPRDQPVCTPRRTGKRPPPSDPCVDPHTIDGVKEEKNQGITGARNPESVSLNFTRGSPFAPAPGVYISPLQDSQDVPRGDNNRPRVVSPVAGEDIASEARLANIPTRHADPHIAKDDIVPDEDNISEPPKKAPNPFPDVRETADDDIEDADDCQGSSQESRDTIESWTK